MHLAVGTYLPFYYPTHCWEICINDIMDSPVLTCSDYVEVDEAKAATDHSYQAEGQSKLFVLRHPVPQGVEEGIRCVFGPAVNARPPPPGEGLVRSPTTSGRSFHDNAVSARRARCLL